jgi:Putative auto-transporter adhesin, head GIN domain
MRPNPASFAAAAGVVATFFAVMAAGPAPHARHLPYETVYKDGDTRTETRNVSGNFKGVSLHTSDDVVVKQGSTISVVVSGPADEVARTETVVENGRLEIRKRGESKMSWSKNKAPVVVTVTMPVIENLSVSSSGDLRTEGKITGTDLALGLAGSGDMHVDADLTGACSTAVAGSGDVRLSGSCANHSVRLAGSGDIQAAKMMATNVVVKLSGSGDISVAAVAALDVSISGSGDVRYAGSPKNLVSRVTGSGSVAKL